MSTETSSKPVMKKSACILCSVNCGLEIQVGGKDGRELLKVKGDKDNPSSEGYVCSKASRLNHYQSSKDRITSPLRRKSDGTYEKVNWDTAIKEIAAGLNGIKQKYGGDKIVFLGGGGQGNHLGGMYSGGLQNVLGVKYRSNPLAQEKTGEFWVNGKMFGGGPHGDFENTEVAVFIGKNPWQTHGFPRTRVVLNEIAKDPNRSMVVLDPCETDTAKMADYHLRVKPGTDAWALSAMVATVIQEGLYNKAFIENHTKGFDEIKEHFESIPIDEYAEIAGLDPDLVRRAARRIAQAESASLFEDLGIQQNVNSTVVSYLEKILWVITGNFANRGGGNIGVPLLLVTDANREKKGKKRASEKHSKYKKSPVLGSRVITGLLPCAEIPEEILTDHPNRFRAAIIESSNPVHSYSNSPRMREAMRALEFSVVIDVALTETAREASYVLPAASSFEKHECVFFQIDFPKNTFHIRHPVVEPLAGTLIEPEIHTRLIEELGGIKPSHVRMLKWSAKLGRRAFAAAFFGLISAKPSLIKVAPSLLYRSLGTTLNKGDSASTAVFWPLCHQFIKNNRESAARAGYTGSDWAAAEKLFNTLISSPSGIVFTDSGDDYSDSWNRMSYPDKKIRLYLEELYPAMTSLDTTPLEKRNEFPLVLTAGQRRAETANTIIRDASWDKKNKATCLMVHPVDASNAGVESGDLVKIVTKTGAAVTDIAITESQPKGFISLPNGLGLEYGQKDETSVKIGVAPNELTDTDSRDFFAGTPWHKFVPARLEAVH